VELTARVWLVIAAGGLLTYLIRASFLLVARRLATVPDTVRDALRMIPAAALAALVAPALLRPDGAIAPFGPEVLAGVVALAVSWWTRNVLLTIVVGLLALVGLEQLLG
jgi:branched-subunit amino acid transport protein